MKPCKFDGQVLKVQSRAPEEGGRQSMSVTVCLPVDSRKVLASLTGSPEATAEAIEQAVKAKARVEMPCGSDSCTLTVTLEKKEKSFLGVTFGRAMVDNRGENLTVKLDMIVPKNVDTWALFGRLIGSGADFSAAQFAAATSDPKLTDDDDDDNDAEEE